MLVKPLLWWLLSMDSRVQEVLSRKKSAEVRLGKIAETLAPIMNDFPIDIQKSGTSTIFLGQPVDFLHIDPEQGITFIEIKSGDSRLSPSQRRIKELVKNRQVRWVDYRIK
jgi:predicted Holliday junction resolvase-like endonuclease